MALRPGGARNGDLAFRMECLLAADGVENDRCLPRLAEQVYGRVDLADVDQPAHAQLVPREPLAIRDDGSVVVAAGGHVRPVRRRKLALRDRLEVEDVERVSCCRDERWFLGLLERASQRIKYRSLAALGMTSAMLGMTVALETQEQRTRGQIRQKIPARQVAGHSRLSLKATT